MLKAELITPPTVISVESIANYLAECSSVVRNKMAKNPMKLMEILMKESYGNTASRLLEYVPCTVTVANFQAKNGNPMNQIFGFLGSGKFLSGSYHTTARELLNWGWSLDEVLAVVDFTNYKTVKCVAPYFIYGQLSTHTQITSVSHSARYTEAGLGYWMPEEIEMYWLERWKEFDVPHTSKEAQRRWNYIVDNYSPTDLQEYMRAKGVKRMEVYSRGADMLAYRPFTLGGYTNNPNAWPHFQKQRSLDAHTQKETREFVEQHITPSVGDWR